MATFLKFYIIFSLPVLLVLGSVRMLMADQFLTIEYQKASFPEDPYGFDLTQRLAFASANVRYLRANQPINVLADQRLEGTPLYNQRELQHMQDVQRVYQLSITVWYAGLGLSLLAMVMLIWRVDTRPIFYTALQWGGLVTVGLIAAIGFLAVIAWEAWFVLFHQVFFAPGTWSFNNSDTLIRLFPEKFWFDAAMTIAGITFLGGLLLAAVGWYLRRMPGLKKQRA